MTDSYPHATEVARRALGVRWPQATVSAGMFVVLTVAASIAVADDTEVFFPAPPTADDDGPRVLLVLPTGRAMGCTIGSTERCDQAIADGSSRMDVLKAALVRVADSLGMQGVSLGLMRGNNDGSTDATASRGGFVAQEIAPLTPERREALGRRICPFDMDRAGCELVLSPEDVERPGQTMLAPSNDAGFCVVDASRRTDCTGRLGPGRQRLTELLFEANRYFAGRRPAWGNASQIGPGFPFPGATHSPINIWGPATVDAGQCAVDATACRYRSPVTACRPNVVVVVSDGVLGPDDSHDEGLQSIANSAGDPPPGDRWFRPYHDPRGATGVLGPHGCSVNSGIEYQVLDPTTGEPTGERLSDCADDLAYSMRSGGFVEGQPAAQVFTHTIGFDVTAATRSEGMGDGPSRELLRLVARAGGGRHHSVDCDRCTPAQAVEALAQALEGVVREAVASGASFAAPAVPVNSFNRTENLDELYLSLFRPAPGQRWRGNVKKYRLAANGDILGLNDVLAVNPRTGQFMPDVASLWPAPQGPEGEDVLRGGAADALPLPEERRIYTNEDGAGTVSLRDHPIERVEGREDAADVLGYAAAELIPPDCPDPRDGAPADPGNPAVCRLVDWIRGIDVADEAPRDAEDRAAGDGDHRESRRELGDPLHSQPVVVDYGGGRGVPRAVVYALTNEGSLHAFDASTGRERWAFIPWDRLARMVALYRDAPVRPRTSLGLDGALRVLRLDRNGNGIIEPAPDGSGDRVVLYFGMRRGGRLYYAVDVTQVDFADPAGDRPALLWIAGPPDAPGIPADRQLPLLGQTWARPVITRLAIPQHSGTDDLVVVVSGGYDPQTQDPGDGQPLPYVDDRIGTGLYVLDAFTGERLWRAGPDEQADLALSAMTSAIPADATVLDLTGDGYADVAYLGDLRGRIWRLDFARNATTRDRLATGGVFASLGATGVAGARRFFAPPDVAWVVHGGRNWLNVAVGSGHRELPLSDTQTGNRFYSLRDYRGRQPRDWSTHVPLTEADLIDVTPSDSADATQAAVPQGSAGWLLRLDSAPGEKVISASRTFENTILFPSFVPGGREQVTTDGACLTSAGHNLLYAVSVVDARPRQRLLDSPDPPAARGLAIRLDQPGIAPPPAVVFPGPDADHEGPATRPQPLCLIGTESCGSLDAPGLRRTWWRERGAE